jgi:F-type H+-transporting ATPase subunit delta
VIADRYAAALFELASSAEGDVLERIDQEFGQLIDLLEANLSLAEAWGHPVLKLADKQAVVRALFAERLHPYLLNLLLLLLEKKRHELIGCVQVAYRERCDVTRKRSNAKVISACPVDEGQLADLQSLLGEQLGSDVSIAVEIDSSLIGGIIVHVGDQVVDASLRGRLQDLKLALK